jgi:NAD+--asparagine ADP-ribosyltransferase
LSDHNLIERKLKKDINFKNALRKDLVESVRQLHKWQEKLNDIGNVRKAKKLEQSVRRYADYVDDLRAFLSPLLNDLESRIGTEMKFSKSEIIEFREEVKEETDLAQKARESFMKAKAALSRAEEDSRIEAEELISLKKHYSAAFRAFRMEKHKLIEVEGELQSELVDREIFKLELKRIMVERHFMSEI